ncbi:hypothetical protein ACO0K9_20735 [Undibacterium sp. Ji50W]|uniref:hypothetical protein n=1 Tax=Undibacterium sp. Ji50W TaxID=3413041 RepID=UPI003BEFA0F7
MQDDLSNNIRKVAIEAQMIAAKILSDLHQPYDLEHLEYRSSITAAPVSVLPFLENTVTMQKNC